VTENIYSVSDIPKEFGLRDFLYGKKFFGANFRDNENIKTINNSLINSLFGFDAISEDLEIVNHGRRFIYVKNSGREGEAIEELVKNNLAFYFGRAKTLSVERGRIASALEGKATKIITEGIEVGTKNLPQRSGFEKRVMEDFFTIVLTEGKERAKEYLGWMARNLVEGTIAKEQLYFKTKAARLNWFDYLEHTDRVRAFQKYKIMEGESFQGIYALEKEGLSRVDEDEFELDYPRYQKKFYRTMELPAEAAWPELDKSGIKNLLMPKKFAI